MSGEVLLNVESVFNSIDGEYNGFLGIGQPSTFIRLRGCNLRCGYCDTLYAQRDEPKNLMSVEEILACPNLLKKVTITGGEPLLQMEAVGVLVYALTEGTDRSVSIETNGSINPHPLILCKRSIPRILDRTFRVRIIADYKLPSSGMEDKMDPDCFTSLDDIDAIKFVVKDGLDLDRVRELLEQHKEDWKAIKVISPCWKPPAETYIGSIENSGDNFQYARELARQVYTEFSRYSGVIFSIQLHKILSLP